MGQNERVVPRILLQSVVEAEAASVMFKGSDLGRNRECSLRKQSPGHEVGQRAMPGYEAAIQLFIRRLCTSLAQAVSVSVSQASPNSGSNDRSSS